ncbi:MAG TPA: ATP-grasp domain-containing protein [Terriglobales bacterium]|nr:ATP-grasp domain-containing protein [Terriglobales bacterium]
MAPDPHVLLVATTTGYQARQFREAAAAMGVRLTLASDRCRQLEDPWGDEAVPVRFEDPKGALEAVRARGPYQGIMASGDRAAVLAAQLAAKLKLRFHSAEAARICHDKFAFKQVLTDAGLPAPWFRRVKLEANPVALAREVAYPCVLKPLLLSASRGVIRANDAAEFTAAFMRIRQLLESPAIQQWRNPNARFILIEGYVAGQEVALEGWMAAGVLQRFVLFDKPDKLEGPFFEESLYVAPSRLETDQRALIWDLVEAAARAVGLGPGPIHAEIRLDEGTAYVLEVAARSIGGLCGRALRFRRAGQPGLISLEELLLRGALGEPLRAWERETTAAGVMMVPIPRSGVLEEIGGVQEAAAVAGIEAVEITAKLGEPLLALPEGASYLGFIFARAATPAAVEAALRAAHAKLELHWREMLPVG